MVWNPEPEVAVARDYGRKFGCNKVIIIGINDEKDRFEIISYGKTKAECNYLKNITSDQIEKLIIDGRITF